MTGRLLTCAGERRRWAATRTLLTWTLLVCLVGLLWAGLLQAVPARAAGSVHDGWCKKGEGLAVVVDMSHIDKTPSGADSSVLIRCVVGGQLTQSGTRTAGLATIGISYETNVSALVVKVDGQTAPSGWQFGTASLTSDGEPGGWTQSQYDCTSGVDLACFVTALKQRNDDPMPSPRFQFAAGGTQSTAPSGSGEPSSPPKDNGSGGTQSQGQSGQQGQPGQQGQSGQQSSSNPPSQNSGQGSRGSTRQTNPSTSQPMPRRTVQPTRSNPIPTPSRVAAPPISPAAQPPTPPPGQTQEQAGGNANTEVWAAETPNQLRPRTPTAGWVPGTILGVLALSGGGIWWGLLHRRRRAEEDVDLDD